MNSEDVEQWNSELDGLIDRLGSLFRRPEPRKHSEQYLRGLLSELPRKNGWTISEHVGAAEPKALQRFLNLTRWDADDVLALNRDYLMENLADPDAVLAADPTGFAKKGGMSVGVQRQYSGTLGRIDNCQIATFLAYVTPDGSRALLNRRLYLPQKSWAEDPARRRNAGVPDDVAFQTRPQQVIDMLKEAIAARVPFAWFTADEEFGQNPDLIAFLQDESVAYVMAIPKNTPIASGRHHGAQIAAAAGRLGHTAWQRRACGVGSKGYRTYDWAFIDTDRAEYTYMIRRSITTGEEAYYRCFNPNGASRGEIVNVAGARWPIEECFGAGKNEVGLDNYQVRNWDPWHRHITLAMLALTFLAVAAHHAKKGAQKQGPHRTQDRDDEFGSP